ncbi:protein kinase [uncultured Croceitalea sp.]|uniref:protein kinase domain-containing protein n=1 Tax=uncultured Croceitalea sp. TaxID=1798908 RepID=UPI00374F8BEE
MAKKTRTELLSIKNIKIDNYKFQKDENSDNIVLGEGGSGIVFKVNQEFVPEVATTRAIKFFVFKDDLIKSLDKYISSINFEDEIVNISKFNHQNILKIIDGGYYNRDEVNIPYIVSDFVSGKTLEEIFEDNETKEKYFKNHESIFDLFQQILNGLIYLHNRKFFHCDIAPKNIFINLTSEGFHVIIGDLGVGHTLGSSAMANTKELLVTGTSAYMPEEVLKIKNKKVNFKVFKKLQPNWDIHSVKLTFEKCIEKILRISMTDKSEHSWLNALISVLKKKYYSLEDLERAIERVRPIHRTIAGLPELSESDGGSWKKLIPLNDVLFTYRVKKITNHPSLIRLKNVPQLLMGSIIFPGSNHTRYEHLLGTYENMRRVLIGLLKKEKFIELFSKDLLELALISSLLANSTRFPFSFAIHELRNSEKSLLKNINQKNLLHKVLNYKEESNGFKYSLLDTINEHFDNIDIELVKKIICGSPSGFENQEVQIIYSLLNSSIDVRVLDFLQRDPHHLGMSNGFQLDIESLVAFLDVYNNKIAIKSQGVSSVEQVISARYWLYKNIYWNQPNRAYTAMLKQIIFELASLSDFESKIIDEFLFATPNELLKIFKDFALEKPDILNLLNLINAKRPRIFKRLYIINKSEEDSVLSGICERVASMKYSELDELRIELENRLSNVINFEKDKINLLIDIPRDENKKLGKDINVVKYDKSVAKLTDISGIVSGINNYFDSHLQWLRIYIHPDYKKQLKENDNWKKSVELIEGFLITKLG